MLRKNYWHFILICMLIALISGIGYASFISNKIYEDSSTHLREIYGEVCFSDEYQLEHADGLE